MEKVFCGKCKWYKFHHSVWVRQSCCSEAYEECRHKSNEEVYMEESYLRIRRVKKRRNYPAERNRNSDCPDYEFKPKWWEQLFGITGYGIPNLKPEDIPPIPPVKKPKPEEL